MEAAIPMSRVTRDESYQQPAPSADPLYLATLTRLERRLARLERRLDEGIGAFLNAKFPHGQATDRWARPRR